MIIISVLGFIGWFVGAGIFVLSYSTVSGIMPMWLLGVAVLPVQLIAGVFVMNRLTIPLAKVMVTNTEHGRHYLTGSICTITSGSVTSSHGTANIERDAGSSLLLNVRLSAPIEGAEVKELKKHDRAVIMEYNEQSKTYLVEPVPTELSEELI